MVSIAPASSSVPSGWYRFALSGPSLACHVGSGTQFFVAILDGWIPGLGSFLSRSFAVASHFEGIQRGVLGAADIMFFLSFSAAFLILNTYSLEGRKY